MRSGNGRYFDHFVDQHTLGSGAITVISPRRRWLDWRLQQLWRCRYLISLFVWRDFASVYRQTILGPVWHVIQPLLTTLTFTVIFGKFAGLSTDGAPPILFYLTGTVVWTYFANSLSNTSATFIANANLFGKVYFHRLVIPISLVISNLITFGIQFGIFLALFAAYRLAGANVHMTTWAFLTPVLLIILAGYGMGGGIIVCALTARYRDLAHLVTFGVQLLMFVTPVIYPLSGVPEHYRWLLRMNPLTAVIEAFRLGFIGVGIVTSSQIITSFGVMLALLSIGLMIFTRVERTVMDTV